MLPVVNNTLPRPQRQVLARFSVSALVASLPLLYVSLLRPPPAALAGDTAFWFLMSNCVIAAIVAADDAGTLFFGSSKPDHTPCFHDDNLSYVSGGSHEPAAAFHFQEEASTMTSRNSIIVDDGALPFFVVHGEGDEVAIAPSTVLLKCQQGREEEMARPSDEAIIPGTEELDGIIKADGALRGSEPEPCLLEVEEVQEEELPEAWAIAQRSRTPDLQQGNKGAAGEGKLRRSVTEGSKPVAAEERDLWELSDEELNRRVEDFIARFNREMRRQVEQEAGV
ncbi:hypothetical protein PR202_gb11633 [Eleusine coracana subsp. coracana]|uniref:Transmembrane protein n=1 Tax=Eleusine coracana subsp. coracana TaxID=191504 RepID=A0AAV5EN63_ELECO|nr:hypothetical protein QOZ80_3BG0269190 [Eleusine coracana subsp. coracana]GJN23937.1 hypothetical protein PR202_gb11633 [Eleusine coracana subsp. coracana]